MSQNHKAAAVVTLALSELIARCAAEVGEPFEEGGLLTVRWSIAGEREAALCSYVGAETFRMEVFDEAGNLVTDVMGACTLFAAGLEMEEGTYSGSATLLAKRGVAVTDLVEVEPFDIEAGDETGVRVDFDDEDFLFTEEIPRHIGAPFLGGGLLR